MEYKSRATLLGIPVIHINTGTFQRNRFRPGFARGWIAFGNVAAGIVFAAGGAAAGGVAFGGVAVGILAFGGLSVGALALGGMAVGLFAFGGMAFAWYLAAGGMAFARRYALGGLASALHANDEAAHALLEPGALTGLGLEALGQSWWLLLILAVPLMQLCVRRRFQQHGTQA